MKRNNLSPELLAPAGDYACFEAALSAGADAVYMGGGGFNARAYAGGFTDDEIKKAFSLSRLYGKKIYITLNTIVFDKEMKEALSLADRLISYGADTFIVQDIGLAKCLKKAYPDIILHASTQMTCVNSDGVKKLSELGFSRAVIAREVPKKDLAEIASKTDTELEYFVHGALCVSVSGQCLFSSVVGKRSGNRGECAQPCRMCYTVQGAKNDFPLSLKDNFLGGYINELSDMGISSLKIEGRMKSPEYVYGVVSSYRKAIDEKRNMSDREKTDLSALFSRSGFTDRYFSHNSQGSHFSMIGFGTDKEKEKTAKAESEIKKIKKTLPKTEADISCTLSKEMTCLSMTANGNTVYVSDKGCDGAVNRPTTEDEIRSQLEKLGDTPFKAGNVEINKEGDLLIPKSLLNGLRREAAERLTEQFSSFTPIKKLEEEETSEKHSPSLDRSAAIRFLFGLPDPSLESLNAVCDVISKNKSKEFEIFLPLFADDRVFTSMMSTGAKTIGAQMPPIFFDSEKTAVISRLEALYGLGIRHILCENIGDTEALRGLEEKGKKMILHAGARFNTANSHTCKALSCFGFESVTLSREINEKGAKYTGLGSDVRRGAVLYGYAPLMLLQRCLYRDMKGCAADTPWNKCTRSLTLKDRTKAEFFTLPAFGHRNILFNSVATLRPDALKSGFDFATFTITRESTKEIKDILYSLFKGKELQGYTGR